MLNRTDRNMLAIWWWTVDRWLMLSVMLLAVMGIFLVMAASPSVARTIGLDSQHFIIRHSLFLAPALTIGFAVSMLQARQIRICCLIGLITTVIAIAAAITIGAEVKGATRWINVFGFNLQPSEFAKPCFAIVSAWLLSLWRQEPKFPGWMISTACFAILAGLLVLQPDIGMTIVIGMTWALQIFLAGMPLAIVLGLAFVIAPILGGGIYFALPHVRERIAKFLEGGSMQADNAMRSFSNGGMTGVGPGNGQIKSNLPDAHSDFIFAVAGEEFGAFACLLIIAIYAFIVFRGFARAGNSENLFAILAIAGLSMQFGLQALIHMASSVHLIPTKGMTLPFISYGGSSLFATALTAGILLALTRRQMSPKTGGAQT